MHLLLYDVTCRYGGDQQARVNVLLYIIMSAALTGYMDQCDAKRTHGTVHYVVPCQNQKSGEVTTYPLSPEPIKEALGVKSETLALPHTIDIETDTTQLCGVDLLANGNHMNDHKNVAIKCTDKKTGGPSSALYDHLSTKLGGKSSIKPTFHTADQTEALVRNLRVQETASDAYEVTDPESGESYTKIPKLTEDGQENYMYRLAEHLTKPGALETSRQNAPEHIRKYYARPTHVPATTDVEEHYKMPTEQARHEFNRLTKQADVQNPLGNFSVQLHNLSSTPLKSNMFLKLQIHRVPVQEHPTQKNTENVPIPSEYRLPSSAVKTTSSAAKPENDISDEKRKKLGVADSAVVKKLTRPSNE